MSDKELTEKLNEVDISNITSIVIRTVGLINIFGKMIIDIYHNNDIEQTIEIQSPVPTKVITEWLDTNKLLDKTVMYEF